MGTTSSGPLSLTYGMTYYWQVRAVNSQGTVYSDNGEWWSFTVIAAPPSNFSKINPIDGAANQLLNPWLYWSTSENATGYQYCVDENDDADCDTGWVTVGETVTSAQIASSLARNTTYYWQVRAMGTTPVDANAGDWWSFTTFPLLPTVDPAANAFTTPEDTLLDGQLTAVSPGGHPLSYWLVDPKPSGLLAVDIDGSFAYQPASNASGPVTFSFMVSDGINVPQGPYQAAIQVTPVNDLPALNNTPDQLVRTGRNVTFTVTATDPDLPYGDLLSFSILEPLPAGAVFESGVFSWTAKWTPLHKEPYTFTVVVTDSGLPEPGTDQQVVRVTVVPERTYFPVISR